MFRLNYLQTADIVDRSSEKLYGVLVHVFVVSDQMLILTPRVFFYLFFLPPVNCLEMNPAVI